MPRVDRAEGTQQKVTASVTRAPFGTMPDGTAVEQITVSNGTGITMKAITYGATITALETPGRDGRRANVVLGFDTLAPYFTNTGYLGAIVGRYGNRIAKGRFTLDGRTYTLAINDGPNHLHGGPKGFDAQVWTARTFQQASGVGVAFSRTSPDGEEGYPGTLKSTVTYTLTPTNTLIVDYQVTTDRATPHNLTQHSYFNLTGGRRDVLGHELMIAASRYTPVDATLIPTGELAPVAGTPFDFQQPTAIGARIANAHEQLTRGRGYDHNFVIDRRNPGVVKAATVYDPDSGRTLEVTTTEPGLQFYSGNFLDGSMVGPGGIVFRHRWGLCLETQHFPDSPNQPAFPSTILKPGETYNSRTVFAFGVRSR